MFMQSTQWIRRQLFGLMLLSAVAAVQAGQTPGMPSPWNGPWGGGFLNGESYNPLANPYIGAGYPVAAPYGGPGGPYPTQPQAMPSQPRQLPGGGYLFPPGAGGAMMPGAYSNH